MFSQCCPKIAFSVSCDLFPLPMWSPSNIKVIIILQNFFTTNITYPAFLTHIHLFIFSKGKYRAVTFANEDEDEDENEDEDEDEESLTTC